ncbi:hypothetical protein ACB092_06G135400 [Castanea dentata]
MLTPFRSTGSPLSLVIGSLYIKHPNLFGGSEKLDVSLDKGLYDSNVLIAYRRPRPEWLAQQSFVIQHSIAPEIGVHGVPMDNFSRSGSGGVNLSRLADGLDLNEPASTKWSSTTSIKFEHIRPLSDDGRSISRDFDGFPVTCSGSSHDNMVVLRQESRYAKANDHSFCHLSLQIGQGIPVLSKWLIFNRFKFIASKGLKLGPAFLLTSLTGGSIVGDMAPYQAFAIGGLGSLRGYGEGAVGSGRSCLVANNELTFPLHKMLEGAIFLDCGTDLGSGIYVPGTFPRQRSDSEDVSGLVEQWPSKKDIGHMFEFIACYVACERANVSKSVLSQILEYLTSQNNFPTSVSSHHITSTRREKQVLALLEVVPEIDWNASYVLGLCEKAQFYQVSGFIHTIRHEYLAALDRYMKDVDEPIHAFSFINKTFSKLLSKNGPWWFLHRDCQRTEVSKHSSFQESRCFYVVSTDGREEDFSYRKCLDSFIKGKYPDVAETFRRRTILQRKLRMKIGRNWKIVKQLNSIVQRLADQMPICSYLICIWIHRMVRSQCLRLLFTFYIIMENHWILCKFWR